MIPRPVDAYARHKPGMVPVGVPPNVRTVLVLGDGALMNCQECVLAYFMYSDSKYITHSKTAMANHRQSIFNCAIIHIASKIVSKIHKWRGDSKLKKIVAILFACIFVFSTTSAYATDYSSLSDNELRQIFNNARNELVKRGFKVEKKTVFFDQNNIQIYINGDIKIDKLYSWGDDYYLYLPIVIVNDSDKNINVIFGDSSLNGWITDVTNPIGSIPAGKKAKGDLLFELENTEIEKLLDFEEAEFTIVIYDQDDWFGENVVNKTKPITLYANTLLSSRFKDVISNDETVNGHLLDILKTGSTFYSPEEVSASAFDPTALVWKDGRISLSIDEWDNVKALYCNPYFDNGSGYIELGLDNDFYINGNDLVYYFDGTWISIERQPIAFYYINTWEDGEKYLIRGYTPAMLNGERTNVIIEFSDENPYGYLAGAVDELSNKEQQEYGDSLLPISSGDRLQFLCNYISYDGTLSHLYKIGEPLIVGDSVEIANVPMNQPYTKPTYCFIDNDDNKYWTPLLSLEEWALTALRFDCACIRRIKR